MMSGSDLEQKATLSTAINTAGSGHKTPLWASGNVSRQTGDVSHPSFHRAWPTRGNLEGPGEARGCIPTELQNLKLEA